MLNLNAMIAVAVAEMQACRRMARTWVFIVLASLISTGSYLSSNVGFMLQSTTSPAQGLTNPRYILADFSSIFIGLFAVGVIFLAFDIRARDVKNRIYEVLDSRPITTIELLTGRLAGVVWLFSIPMLVFILLVLIYSAISQVSGFGFGEPVEMWSVASFVVFDMLPNLMFWGAFVIFLAVLVRWRILVVLLALGFMIGVNFLVARLPLDVQLVLVSTGSYAVFPSDLAPVFVNTAIFLNRVALLLLTAGFLFAAAAMHMRREATRSRDAFIGCGSFALGVVVMIWLCMSAGQQPKDEQEWGRIHSEEALVALPDINKIEGQVDIFPGNKIRLDIQLEVVSSSLDSNEFEVFSLNPGYKIDLLEVDGGPISEFVFEAGLLKIPKKHFHRDISTLKIQAHGKPNLRFAYLDSAIRIDEKYFNNVNFNRALGTANSIFHPNFVALLPGIKWLPTSGPAVGEDQIDVRKKDHFNVDLRISTPKHWLAAGPGIREKQVSDKRAIYRFKPANTVPAITIVAAEFELASIEIDDIEFEFLFNKKHRRTMHALAKIEPALREWGEEKLKLAKEIGLSFPYKQFSIVEVPSRLRVYAGGWRMESVLSQPGLVMVPEKSLPTARFDTAVANMQKSDSTEEELSKQIFSLVESYFRYDLMGGSVKSALAQQFVRYQTTPHGQGATGLDFVLQELTAELIFREQDYFSVPTFIESPLLLNSLRSASSIRDQVDTNRVWETIEDTPLSQLNYDADPLHTYHVHIAKYSDVVTAMTEILSKEQLRLLLTELLAQFRGTNFSYEELLNIASQQDLQIEGIVGDWLNSATLPGFMVSSTEVKRLEDDEQMNSVYETTFNIRNGEPATGVVKIQAIFNDSDGNFEGSQPVLDPIKIPGNTAFQMAVHTDKPPNVITVIPYLAYNRGSIVLTVPELEDYEIQELEPQPQIVPVDWTPFPDDAIVVDDLDSGFSVTQDYDSELDPELSGILRFIASYSNSLFVEEMDRGLPLDPRSLNPVWQRSTDGSYFGRYRRTAAINYRSGEKPQATFSASFSESGNWQLEFYVGSSDALRTTTSSSVSISLGGASVMSSRVERWIGGDEKLGIHTLEINNGSTTITEELDVGQIEQLGWVIVGEYPLDKGPVTVTVSGQKSLLADAIRWTNNSAND